MDKPLFEDVVRLLLSHMSDQRTRRAILQTALFGSPLLDDIEFEGRPRPFTADLVNQIITYDGKESKLPSLIAVLNEVKERVGEEQHPYINSLIKAIQSPGSPREKPPIPQPPFLYALPPYSGASTLFTGREEELAMLNNWSQAEGDQPMCVLVAIGGMGKSALTWQWMQQQIKAEAFEGVFWYSFYEGGAEMRDCVRYALAYVTRQDPDTLKGGNFEAQLSQLIEALKKGRYLLVLDGLERVLVAYHRWDAAQMQDDSADENTSDRDHCDCTNPRDEEALWQLTTIQPSRVLISSRLFPNALLEAGRPTKAVRDERLSGLSPKDARAMWREYGIKWHNEAKLDQFFNHIGRHGLLLKIAAGAINSKKRRRGHFDTWYTDLDEKFDFASKDLKTKRHHILEMAYKDLSQEGRDLLAQIATFGTAVSFETLNVFNPYLPAKPVEEPEERSFWLSHYRRRLQEANTEEDKARYQAAVEREEEKLRLQAAYDTYQRDLKAWEKASKSAIRPFETLLTDLEGRGLLWWDETTDLYDLHPVVRGYAYSGLSDEERRTRHDRSYNLFESQEEAFNTNEATTLVELHRAIAMYHALIGAGRLDDAADLFDGRLFVPLVNAIGAYPKAYELLLPLFGDGLDHLPTLTGKARQSTFLTTMGAVLSPLYRQSEELRVSALKIKLELDQRDAPNLGIALGNYGLSLRSQNQLAQALHVQECYRDLARTTNDHDGLALASLSLLDLYSDLGRWTDADATYASFVEQPPSYQTDYWRAGAQRVYTASLLYRGAPLDHVQAAIEEGQRLALVGRSALELRQLARLRGEIALKANQIQQAVAHFQEAIERGRQSGVYYGSAYGGLARAYLALGQLDRALRIVEECDNYSAACVYQAAGQLDKAREHARDYYEWAWADGEPYVNRYELEQAKELLLSLGKPIPDLPIWDESKYEKFPYEDEVRAFIEKLKAEKAAKEAETAAIDESDDDEDSD